MRKDKIKIALDVDGVLANFTEAIIAQAQRLGYGDKFPAHCDVTPYWNMCEDFNDFLHVFGKVSLEPWFWQGVRPLGNRPDFTPAMYLTSRPIETSVSKTWLDTHGFPEAPVETVSLPEMKLQVMHEYEIDVLVDDYYKTVKQINESQCGTLGILFEAPYQRGHVDEINGMPKINKLEEAKIAEIYANWID